MNNLDTPSDYLVRAADRAASMSETDARAKRAEAFEAELETIAEQGRRAFFNVITRTDTERLLFEARSEAQSLNQRELLSRAGFDALLLEYCMKLVRGDTLKAQLLASAAKEF